MPEQQLTETAVEPPKHSAASVSLFSPTAIPAQAIEGQTTRLIPMVFSRLKEIYMTSNRWPNIEELLKIFLEYTGGDKLLTISVWATLTAQGAEKLHPLLRQKGVAQEELNKLQDKSVAALMRQYKTLLDPNLYEEQPFFKLIKKLEDFDRHDRIEKSWLIDEHIAQHGIKPAKLAPFVHFSNSQNPTTSTEDHLREIHELLKRAETRAEQAEERARKAEEKVERAEALIQQLAQTNQMMIMFFMQQQAGNSLAPAGNPAAAPSFFAPFGPPPGGGGR